MVFDLGGQSGHCNKQCVLALGLGHVNEGDVVIFDELSSAFF